MGTSASYYGLSALPFGKGIPTEVLQLLPSVEKNLAAARLLVDTHGIGAMVGKSGTGKSCLLRLLVAALPAGLFRPLYLCHTSVGILEFYTHLCALFGLSASCRRVTMFRDLQEHILSMNGSRHLHPVLLIDEAHLLSNEILAEIRLLTNFRIDSFERPDGNALRRGNPFDALRSVDAGGAGHLHHRDHPRRRACP